MYNEKKLHLEDLLEWYKKGLETGYIFENGILLNSTFVNIVKSAIGLQKFDWADNFIKTYKSKLEHSTRTGFVEYASIHILIKKTGLKEAVPLLEKVNWTDIYIQLESRRLLLRFYYDAYYNSENDLDDNYWNKIANLLKSFSNYLNSCKDNDLINKTHFDLNKNFIDFTKRIHLIEADNRSQIIKQLKKDIEETSTVAEKAWLKSKIGEL